MKILRSNPYHTPYAGYGGYCRACTPYGVELEVLNRNSPEELSPLLLLPKGSTSTPTERIRGGAKRMFN